ncbi:MAG TPA: DUF4350 domain-containing protein [Cellvibrio sp.]|nr:DUF4350 domain-containing protein [Cellvibrio sp.]
MAGASSTPAMSRTQKKLLLGAIVIIVAVAAYWAYSKLEWQEKEIDLGYSKEAQQNDYLAAEIFLRKHGIRATSVKNLSLLDKHRWRNLELGPNDTLVLINANKTLTQERYDRLYEWVENGGTLITSTQNPFVGTHTDEEDLLLSDFNITPAGDNDVDEAIGFLETLSEGFNDDGDEGKKKEDDNKSDEKHNNNEDEVADKKETSGPNNKEQQSPQSSKNKATAKSDTKEEKPENYYRCSLDEVPTEIDFANEAKPLRLDFSRRDPFIYHPYHSEDNYAEDSEELPEDESLGDESTTENTNTIDETIVGNESTETGNNNTESYRQSSHLMYFEIGEGGITITSDNDIWSNQRIDCHDHAYALWSLVNPEGRVWFLTNQDAPSLAAIIWHYAKYAVLAAVISLALWLWAHGSRFGPVFNVEQQGRRSLAEHIYASAMLLWRKQQHPQLLKLLREEIMAQLAQQHVQANSSRSEQVQILQQITGLKESDIHHALFAEDLQHPQAFSVAIAHLQIIRKQL